MKNRSSSISVFHSPARASGCRYPHSGSATRIFRSDPDPVTTTSISRDARTSSECSVSEADSTALTSRGSFAETSEWAFEVFPMSRVTDCSSSLGASVFGLISECVAMRQLWSPLEHSRYLDFVQVTGVRVPLPSQQDQVSQGY